MVVSSQILVAQEAPEGVRGSVSGFFGICASVGILVATKLGGYMFDAWTESSPFLLFAIFNGFTLIFSLVLIIVRRRQGHQALLLAD
jgi:sugar phosphate permease